MRKLRIVPIVLAALAAGLVFAVVAIAGGGEPTTPAPRQAAPAEAQP